MHEQGTPKIETQEDAVQVLLAWQVESGGIETIPGERLDGGDRGGLGVLQRQRLPRNGDAEERGHRGGAVHRGRGRGGRRR